MAFTPGPNNTILMASGIAHGFRATLPVVFGVALGFPFQALCIGLGLGKIFELWPVLLTVLKYAGAVYMLWLCWKIATDKPKGEQGGEQAKPLSFLQAMAFQWVNPKAWIMAITALTTYTIPGFYWIGLATVVGTFVFTGITSASTWAGFGAGLKALLTDPRWFRPINISLALLLLVSLVPMLRH
nr:LysE family translocator [Aestuariivirga litoralis]